MWLGEFLLRWRRLCRRRCCQRLEEPLLEDARLLGQPLGCSFGDVVGLFVGAMRHMP